MNNPLVTIITPSYNSAQFISQTIKSILNQTYTNWELIIVDDCSIGDSIEVIQNFVNHDSRIQLIQLEENSGAPVARNKGIEVSKGSYIAFLDADDLWKPTKLEKQLKFMIKNNYYLTYTSYEKIDTDDLKIGEVKCLQKVNYKKMLSSNKIGCLTGMYNAEKLGKIYFPLIRKRQDYAYWLSILKKIDFAYGYDEILASYRVHTDSISHNKIEMLKWNWTLFREIENFSVIKSFYYLLFNIYNKIF